MDSYLLITIYFIVGIFISFMCSLLEASLLSTPVSYLQSKIDSGSKVAEVFMKIKNEKINDAISAILILNTISHTIASALIGAEATKVLGQEWFGVVTGLLTFCILVFSELAPKALGANKWRSLIGLTANTLNVLIKVLYPIVVMSRYVMKVASGGEVHESLISREEVSSMASLGEKEKVFSNRESTIIKSLLASDKLTVKDIMTPRTVAKTFDINTKLTDFPDNFEFSRIPVWEGEEDNIIGIAYKSDIYQDWDEKYPKTTIKDTDYDKDIIFIPETTSISKLFEIFLKTKQHLSIVVDEYGTFVGLSSFEDVVETLLGIEIVDETDKVEDLQEYAKKLWEEKRNKTIREINN